MSTDTVQFGDYDKATREEFVRKGWALPDKESGGAFPVKNRKDLEDALHRIGTTNHPRAQVVAFLRKRAKELDAEDVLGDKTAPTTSHGVTIHMKDTAVFGKLGRQTPDGMIIRRGKVFEAGSRLDMHGIPFVTTQKDLNHMVMNFKPFSVGSGHPEAESPLDGHLGTVTNLFLGKKPTDLYAEVCIPPFVDDVLTAEDCGRVSMVFNRHTKEPLGLDFVRSPNVVDAALMASFAKQRHDTPDGQKFMQNIHDACAKRGAVCRQKSSNASRHEVSATQQCHDIAAQHGAKCAGNAGFAKAPKGRTMDLTKMFGDMFTGLFEAAEKVDKQQFAGDDPAHEFEADWPEEQNGGIGEPDDGPDEFEANSDVFGTDPSEDDEDTDANPEDNPVPGTGGGMSSNMSAPNTNTVPEAQFSTVLQRNVQLEAELLRERAHRIESEAVHFADGEIQANRSLPAEREGLIEQYRQAAADDSAIGVVKLADGRETSRVEKLVKFHASRQEHWMTKETLATTLSPEVIAMAIKTHEAGDVKPMDDAKKQEYLKMSRLGQSVLAAQK